MSRDRLRELIAFQIGEQEYCVDIMSVREIRGWTPTTIIPHAKPHMRGVINLRGTVLPVIDLRARFGLGISEPQARSVIIVVRSGHQEAGLLVDAVCDILTITNAMIQPTPGVASDSSRSIIRGIIAHEGRMISLVGLEEILPQNEARAA